MYLDRYKCQWEKLSRGAQSNDLKNKNCFPRTQLLNKDLWGGPPPTTPTQGRSQSLFLGGLRVNISDFQ